MSDPFQLVAATINREWVARYGGEAVDDPQKLANRVFNLAQDRDAWIANCKACEKERAKVDAELARIKANDGHRTH